MSFQLYTYVALKEDLPKYGLKKGQIAMVIEHYEMPEDQEDGYSLEGFGIDIPGITVEVSESQIYSITDYLAYFNRPPAKVKNYVLPGQKTFIIDN